MYIGVYLCASGVLFLLGPGWLLRRGGRWPGYIALAGGLSAVALLAFEILSAAAGLTTIGRPGHFNYPGDYLASGPVGWGLMLLPPLGVVSPLLVAWWSGRRARGGES